MTDTAGAARVWAIIPAAGIGRRMGRRKQSLPFRGSTIVGTVVRTVLDADVFGAVVVTRTELIDALQLPADPRTHVAINDDAGSEMIDSIRIGLSFLAQSRADADDGVLVVPADMPTVSAETCRACIAAYAADPKHIVIATHEDRRGHPIIFPFSMRSTIDRLDGGLRMLPQVCPDRVCLVEVDDPGADTDIDTNEDYEELSRGDTAGS